MKGPRRARIVPRIPDWNDLVEKAQVLLLVHAPTGIGIDISLAWLPFEQQALDHAEVKAFAGTSIRAVRPEDLLIYKLIAHRSPTTGPLGRRALAALSSGGD